MRIPLNNAQFTISLPGPCYSSGARSHLCRLGQCSGGGDSGHGESVLTPRDRWWFCGLRALDDRARHLLVFLCAAHLVQILEEAQKSGKTGRKVGSQVSKLYISQFRPIVACLHSTCTFILYTIPVLVQTTLKVFVQKNIFFVQFYISFFLYVL